MKRTSRQNDGALTSPLEKPRRQRGHPYTSCTLGLSACKAAAPRSNIAFLR
jgi:hypothetical protein